jgi:ribosomal protein L17
MDNITRQHFDNLQSKDAELRYQSFQFIIKQTNEPVDYAYEVWDELLALTKKGDNHQRTIAVQVLSNLAKSDPKQKMIADLDKLMLVTKDEKFVTARHSLLCLWKIGIVNDALKAKLLNALSKRYKNASPKKIAL